MYAYLPRFSACNFCQVYTESYATSGHTGFTLKVARDNGDKIQGLIPQVTRGSEW